RSHCIHCLVAVRSEIQLCNCVQVVDLVRSRYENMEDRKPLGLKHRPLTPFRFLRGLICLTTILLTAFTFLVYFAPPAAILLRLFSIHYSRKVVSFIFCLWLALWPCLFEKINKTKVVFSGDCVPAKERVLIIANHRTEVDWMYLWNFALRKGRLGHIKYVLKSSLMKLPIFSWAFHLFEFIPVERNWDADEKIMQRMLSQFTDPMDPLWLSLFPEGTDYTEQKCIKNQKFAVENGLPVLKNVLLPKTKGFFACVETLGKSLDAVYDVTIAYKNNCPVFMDNVFGVDPSEVHMHIRRFPIKDIPTSEDDAGDWLMDKFQLKDKLLADFSVHGHFPCKGTERELSTLSCLVNVGLVLGVTALFIYFALFSIWVKLYLVLSCAYLTLATHFNFQPSPITGFIRKMLYREKQKIIDGEKQQMKLYRSLFISSTQVYSLQLDKSSRNLKFQSKETQK
ncbi:hypothetical protein V2J09_011734, partial [Rumex salicifolius]